LGIACDDVIVVDQFGEESGMTVERSIQESAAAGSRHVTLLAISRWVNEPYPPLNELLSAHDVARLMRRPRWQLTGLCLIGWFPRKLRFRGRGVGWRRSEVLDWIARNVPINNNDAPATQSSEDHTRQACLPLENDSSLVATKKARRTSRARP
jgi:hypothetical protein